MVWVSTCLLYMSNTSVGFSYSCKLSLSAVPACAVSYVHLLLNMLCWMRACHGELLENLYSFVTLHFSWVLCTTCTVQAVHKGRYSTSMNLLNCASPRLQNSPLATPANDSATVATVFAPTDAAFQSLASSLGTTVSALGSNPLISQVRFNAKPVRLRKTSTFSSGYYLGYCKVVK